MGFLNWFRKYPKVNEEWFLIKKFKSKIEAESYAKQLISKKYPIETFYP